MVNVTCKLKPTRDGYGNFTAFGTPTVPLYDFWVNNRAFYKLRTYLPFMVNYDVDICEMNAKGPKALGLGNFGINLYNAIDELIPGFNHPCPYDKTVGVWGLNVDRLMKRTLPQIIPHGTYKFEMRFHTGKTNETVLIVTVLATSDSKDPMKRFFMG